MLGRGAGGLGQACPRQQSVRSEQREAVTLWRDFFFLFPNRDETRRDETTARTLLRFLPLPHPSICAYCWRLRALHRPITNPLLESPPRALASSPYLCVGTRSAQTSSRRPSVLLVSSPFTPIRTTNQVEPKMPFQADKNDQLAINTIRTLALE